MFVTPASPWDSSAPSSFQMISIIIPTLEEEKAIGETLRALKSQLTLPHEIIISDGGSTDRTVEIARPLSDKVIVYAQPPRQTIAQGRNDGAKAARGDFFVFLDADCTVPEPDHFFRSAIAQFEADKELVGLTSHLRFTPGTETLIDKLFLGFENLAIRLKNNLLGLGDSAGGEFQMVRASAFTAIGGYRADLVTCEDRDLFSRLSRIGKTRFDHQLTVFHPGRRVHQVGWPRLIFLFVVNTLSFRFLAEFGSKTWSLIR